jgi:hypothetical protein
LNEMNNKINELRQKIGTILLLLFTILYNSYTIYLVYTAINEPGTELGPGVALLLLWILGFIILGLIIFLTKIKFDNPARIILLAFSTPIPFLTIFFIWCLI